jgi:hypothetical protein
MPLSSVRLTPAKRRALALLAAEPGGCPEPILRVEHGIDEPVTVLLIEEGLVSARHEKVRTGGRLIDVLRLHITPAGREALGGVR